MTAGRSAIAAGVDALIGVHGESLLYRSVADVVHSENGEVITGEGQDAVLLGNESDTEIAGIFEEEYDTVNAVGVGTTAPAAFIRTSDMPDAARGDSFTRESVRYYVVEARPNTPGTTLLILSRDAH